MAMAEKEQGSGRERDAAQPAVRYGEKTARIRAWSALAGSLGHLCNKALWMAVMLIIVASFGRYLHTREIPTRKSPSSKPVVSAIDWQQVDREIVATLAQARAASEALAAKELESWVAQLMERVDHDFLAWYFGYWTQQLLGFKSLYYSAVHFIGAQPTAAERITEDVQEQFAQRVLRPEIAQLALENLTREVVNQYVSTLRHDLTALAHRYRIPHGEWEAHLAALAAIASQTEGNRRVELSLKTLMASTAVGTVFVAKALTPMLQALGRKVLATSSGTAAAQVATKTGGKVAAKVGGEIVRAHCRDGHHCLGRLGSSGNQSGQ